jgi:hypothetical protein
LLLSFDIDALRYFDSPRQLRAFAAIFRFHCRRHGAAAADACLPPCAMLTVLPFICLRLHIFRITPFTLSFHFRFADFHDSALMPLRLLRRLSLPIFSFACHAD